MDIYLSEEQAVEACKLAERDRSTLTEEEKKRLLDLQVRAHFTLAYYHVQDCIEAARWKKANGLT